MTRTVSIVEDDSAALLAKALLTYFEKSNFSIPFQERILPSTMKYAESVQRGYSVCTEVLVRKDHITAGPVSQEGLSLEKPKIASLSPDYLEIPTLCLEDILRDENNLLDTLDDTLDVKPFEKTESLVNIASASHTNTLMTSNDPLSSSRLHQFKISQILDSDDAIVDSLLTNLIEERILPTVSQISSESQYQWASTTPLSEAEYEALR